jgi:hypothetical protein
VGKLTSEEARGAVAATKADEDETKSTLRQKKGVSHGRPGDTSQWVRQAKANEAEVGDSEEQQPLRLVQGLLPHCCAFR